MTTIWGKPTFERNDEPNSNSTTVSGTATSESLSIPPFTCSITPDDANPGCNYAIPDEPPTGDVGKPLDDLAAYYRGQGRAPHFEFLEVYAPAYQPIG